MPRTVSALPSDAILVHIGPHKTGTTALQSMLHHARPAMAEAGVLYPGTKGAHHDEARSLRRLSAGWSHDGEATPDPAVWDRVVQDARAATGRVVISSEFFAQSDEEQRAKLVRDLGPDRVHLIMAARNPASIAVSTWQQVLRQGWDRTLDEWLDVQFRRASSEDPPSTFWFWADAASLAERWATEVTPDRMNVLVLDEGDRSLLPRTFEQLLDLPEGTLSNQPAKSNRGLTAPEAELLSKVLARIDGGYSWDEYSKVVRGGMLLQLVEGRTPPPDEPRSQMPPWAVEQGERDAEDIIERLRALDDMVIGDLDALRRGPAAADPLAPITEVPLDLAADAIVGAMTAGVRQMRTTQDKLDKARERIAKQRHALKHRSVDELSTRQLARALAGRVRRRALRRTGSTAR
ncbi:MAG TPA: hypothetical protein VJ872_04500 [Nocardioides sp.]|nr:hypothetical protein [Nocardioides sp.]